MQPYFKTNLGELYHADCRNILRHMANNEVDLVLTDPPYGIGEAAGKNKSRGTSKQSEKNRKGTPIPSKDFGWLSWDNEPPSFALIELMREVSHNQVIFGGNYFRLPPTPCWIVWDKKNGNNDFADCELAWTSFSSAVRMIRYRWAGMLQENMKEKEVRHHPTQKPVAVMRWILEKYANPEHVILDPFMGSGTTAIACEQLGIKWIGVEREEQYCEIAAKRLSQPIQKNLFSI